jgi:DNA-binding transcriptional ArsR family regulator
VHAFDVLADPVRRRILELLAGGERSAGALGAVVRAEFGISQPAVSQHLRVLRDTGFVRVRPVGTARFYAADPDRLREADDWLRRVRRRPPDPTAAPPPAPGPASTPSRRVTGRQAGRRPR